MLNWNEIYVYFRDVVRKYLAICVTEQMILNILIFSFALGETFDLDLAIWLLAPLIVSFLLPLLIGLLFYITAVILYIYKLHKYA